MEAPDFAKCDTVAPSCICPITPPPATWLIRLVHMICPAQGSLTLKILEVSVRQGYIGQEENGALCIIPRTTRLHTKGYIPGEQPPVVRL